MPVAAALEQEMIWNGIITPVTPVTVVPAFLPLWSTYRTVAAAAVFAGIFAASNTGASPYGPVNPNNWGPQIAPGSLNQYVQKLLLDYQNITHAQTYAVFKAAVLQGQTDLIALNNFVSSMSLPTSAGSLSNALYQIDKVVWDLGI